LEVAEDSRDLVRSGSFSHESLPGSLPVVRFPLRLDQVLGGRPPYFLECVSIWFSIAISRFLLRQGRAGQTEFLSDTTPQACLADGHQPQGPTPFFPGGEWPPGGDPAFLAPGKRGWPPTSPQRSRQQAAEDLPWIIERFANCADMIGRSTYKALVAIFNRQCEVSEGKAWKGHLHP